MVALDLNASRFDPAARRGHVESWFLKATDPAAERAIWLKATIYAATSEPERAVVEGWAIAFDRRSGVPAPTAVKCTVPASTATLDRAGFGVSFAGGPTSTLSMSPGQTTGALASRPGGPVISWDLRYEGEGGPILPFFARSMYTAPIPKQKLLTPVPDARMTGKVVVAGETWELDGWHGMQGHNWGRGHADLYAWSHINQWDGGEDIVFEGFSARIRVGPVLTPLTTVICMRHRGVSYDFNGPVDLLRATGDVTLRRWEFAARCEHGRVEGSLEAATDDFAGLHYPNPDGAMTYCLNSKLARAHIQFEPRGRAPMRLASRAAALEIGTRDEHHGVRMLA